ncbi:MAG: hypothetical protein IKR80_06260 [Spirochaetales bacterium]|nr:hypothetical protein [Spirochaetales bacterium]
MELFESYPVLEDDTIVIRRMSDRKSDFSLLEASQAYCVSFVRRLTRADI